jgi:site-specific recombinase XerD
VDTLFAAGYSRYYVRHLLGLTHQLAAYMGTHHLLAEDLNAEVVQRFLHEARAGHRIYRTIHLMVEHLAHYLRQHGVRVPEEALPAVVSPWTALLARYDQYLDELHGLQLPTRQSYSRYAAQFLLHYQQTHGIEELADLSAREVLAYVTASRSEQAPRGQAKLMATVMRSVLRFLYWEQVIPTPLDGVVPVLRCWRLAPVPKHLPWAKVRQLIEGIDVSTPLGQRNQAIILLLAVLGLRNRDVCHLEVGHIAWREGELRLPRTKAGRARCLPLPQEVGEALARYLMEGRPSVQSPYVFVSHKPPFATPLTSGALTRMMGRSLRQLQIEAPQYGTHVLRHSLATHLVNARVPIKEVADLLGHVSIDTTAIYTKVDRVHLTAVALPFPGGA